jgi:choline dehydrogenase-like flavoprotein
VSVHQHDSLRLADVAASPLRADVCVVGAGAAGLAIAHSLRGSGRSILVLESGPVADPTAFHTAEIVGLPYNGVLHGRVRGNGGTTAVWPGQCMRLRPDEYAAWPFGPDELAPWYGRSEQLLGIRPEETTRDFWELFGGDPGFDPARIDSAMSVFAPRRRLSSLDLGDTKVVTGATVTRVENGRAEVRDLDGRSAEVEAATIVLCTGALETPRLLLASGFDHPALGRFLQDHAVCRPAKVVGRARSFQDRYGMRFKGGRRYAPKLLTAPELRLAHGVPSCMANVVFDYSASSPLEAALRVRRALKARQHISAPDLGRIVVGAPRLATAAMRVTRGREPAPPPDAVRVLTVVEQVPRAESRISLAEERDPLGVPRLRVDWRLGEEERRSIQVLVETLDDELRRTGAGALEPEAWLSDRDGWAEHVFDAFHPAGTARMAPEGVVDADCRVRGLRDTYVCGSAVFPASGCTNPTLTIVALALRLADHLKRS